MIAPATATTIGFDLARCVVFDLEVYPGRWCVGFQGPDARGKLTTFIVDGDTKKLTKTLDQLRDRGMILVGYNSAHFDIRVIKCILNGFDPYEPAQQIIGGCLCDPYRDWSDFRCDSIDLSARLRRGGAFPGLKTVAANMGRPTLRELPYPPDAVLTDQEWNEIKVYNRIDLEHTWALLQLYAPELQALASLSDELGQDMRSTSSPQLVERVFLEAYRRKHRGDDPIRLGTPGTVSYRPVEGVVKPRTPAAAAWFDQITTDAIPIVFQGSRPKPNVPAAHFTIGDLKLSVGAGGLHSIDSPRIYYSTPSSRLVSVDVASFYPSLIASKGISPAAYGAIGSATYRDILERRLRIKAEAKTVSDPDENKRLEVQATALKLILNSTFGKFGDSYSSLFDPEALLAVTLSGQLMLIDLIERLTEAKVRVLSANTDGLFLRVPRNGKRWRKVLARWQRDTEMKLEVDGLKRLVILATNIYATLDARGKVKRRGDKLKGSLSPTTAPNALVVNDAIADALLRDVPPERTVWVCKDLVRFCRVSKRSAKVLDAVLVDDATQAETTLPKITRWYRAKDSQRRIVHRLGNDRHTTPADANNVSLALDLVDGKLPDDLDRSWYIARARRVVQKVPGYRHRSVKRLDGHELALQVFNHGLVPVPKWDGKAQLPGSDPASPTLLWDWSRIETVGTYTGPAVSVLVLDVDEFASFRKWVDKDNDPLFGDRWKTLDGCLVSIRGATTAESVRSGRGRGKLLFRLEAGPDHPLSKLAVGHWKKARGVEVFYGKGVPSILGEYPGDEPYRLDGRLGEAPAWLLEGLTPRPKKVSGKAQENGHTDTAGPNWEFAKMDLQRVVDLRDILRGRFQELANGSVGWETAEDSKTGRPIVVGRCPFPHDSGESDPRDLSIGYHDDGPYYHCLHASCSGKTLVNDWLKAEYGPKKASGAGPVGGSTVTPGGHNPSSNGHIDYAALSLTDMGVEWAKDIEDEPVDWINEHRLAVGKLHITAGAGGLGKSQYTIAEAAAVSNGNNFPDGGACLRKGVVIVLAAEDGKRDTIVPRLKAAGADLSMVSIQRTALTIKTKDGSLLVDIINFQNLPYWDALFAKLNPVLLIADPIPAFMGANVNDHRNADVRRVLEPFVDLLGRCGVAMEAVTHVGKSTKDKSATDQILGSVAYANLARRVNIAWLDPETPGRYILTNPKLNIGPKQPAIGYTIEQFAYPKGEKMIVTSRAKFEAGTFEVDENQLRQGQKEARVGKPGPEPIKMDALTKFIFGFLRGKNPVPWTEVADAAGDAGLLGTKKWNDDKGRSEWTRRPALYEANRGIPKLPPPDDGWMVATPDTDSSLKPSRGPGCWQLRRIDSPF